MCKSPLIGFPYVGHYEDGIPKWKYHFQAISRTERTGFDLPGYVPDAAGFHFNGNGIDRISNRFVDRVSGEMREPIKVSCGQCNECRLAYAKMWADRCVMEAATWPDETNWFVTLTYDPKEDHRIISPTSGLYTLVPEDLKKFEHDLRQKLALQGIQSEGVRFFGCGEYGDKFGRCHWHLLLFNCRLPDVVQIGKNFNGDALYSSDFLCDVWKHGFVALGKVNWQTAAYTARYVMKKRKGKDADFYAAAGIVPEFTRMSRRPGIGSQFIHDHADEFLAHGSIFMDGSNGRRLNGGRYVRNIISGYADIDYWRKKEAQEKIMDDLAQARREASTLTDAEYFSLRSEHKDHVATLLKKFRENIS